jgi:hypothetical protein
VTRLSRITSRARFGGIGRSCATETAVVEKPAEEEDEYHGHHHHWNTRRQRYLRTYCRWVIDDSIPWKDELVKVAERLDAKTKQKRWTAQTGYLIERDFVVSAYAMRQLVESHQVSEGLRERQIPVRRFDLKGTPPNPLFPADIADAYDFENGRRRTLSVVDLCHEILHNYFFTFCCGETADLFDGVYVSSDREKSEYVYLVLASDFIALCGDIGEQD